MSGRCGYSATSIPMQEILIYQMHCGQLLPLGLLYIKGS
jgi:hypothetical protein